MKFLVTDISNPDNARVIEGSGFRFEDNRCVIVGGSKVKGEEIVASLLNVNIEPLASGGRESSKTLVKLAQKYRTFSDVQLENIVQAGDDSIARLCDDIKSLAGSVLSQAGKD